MEHFICHFINRLIEKHIQIRLPDFITESLFHQHQEFSSQDWILLNIDIGTFTLDLYMNIARNWIYPHWNFYRKFYGFIDWIF